MVVSRRGASARAPRTKFESASNTRIIVGDCVAEMSKLPAGSVDLVFADPPYNLQLEGRPEAPRPIPGRCRQRRLGQVLVALPPTTTSPAPGCSPAAACMKPSATLWVIGSYHNIFRVGAILQDLGFWILNDIVWRKTNPMPNFRGRRFTNAHETMIWAARDAERQGLHLQLRGAEGRQRRRAGAFRLADPALHRRRAAEGHGRQEGPPDAEAGRRCWRGSCCRRRSPAIS